MGLGVNSMEMSNDEILGLLAQLSSKYEVGSVNEMMACLENGEEFFN